MKSKQNSSEIHLKRIALLQAKVEASGLSLCIVDNPLDIFYLTGLKLSAGRLFVHPAQSQLFVDGRYIESALENAPVKAVLEEESALQAFLKKWAGKKIGFDSNCTSYEQFLKLQALCAKHTLVPLASFYQSLRLIKDKGEIALMEASAALLYRGLNQIRSLLRVGVSEKEVARGFEIFCLQEGAEKMAFEPIIAFGANSAMPHHRAGGARLKKGDMILVDIGTVLGNYHSDMTRMFFFHSIDPFFSTVYEVVRSAQTAALKLCRPGTAVGKLDTAARSVMRRCKMEPFFLHSLGHGIGLETHEFPRIKFNGKDKDLVLEPGMVITIEPGLYFSGRGGIRYEDTVVITQTGYENFFPEMKKNQVLIR